MSTDRIRILDASFRTWLNEAAPTNPQWRRADLDRPIREGSGLTGRKAVELFESQIAVRHLDGAARWLRRDGRSFYTISSAGHEGDAVLGDLLRGDDPTLLHYRCGGLVMQRARRWGANLGETPIFDICLSLACSAEDPVSGGRHKVFGSSRLWLPPQTSTIASHLPKALGLAFALERVKRLDHIGPAGLQRLAGVSEDAVVACVFGDASLNHAVARGSLAAARWVAYQHLDLPLLLVCEDNGLGISVRTPRGWVERSARALAPDIDYVQADGLDLASAWDGAAEAIDRCRRTRRPVFLHLRTVRLLAHAGSDIEAAYRPEAEILADEARDPVLSTARLLVEANVLTPEECLQRYEELKDRVYAAADEAADRPQLSSIADVVRPLAPMTEPTDAPAAPAPLAEGTPRHLSRLLNMALAETLDRHPGAVLFGEDVARKGGVYGVTQGLERRFGRRRVFNTLLDETTILGLAQGFGMLGMLPIPEIQYLAYLHNAEDQLRSEACSLQFFSRARYANPMVVRIASFGYQKGFGGHFHNDNSIAVLRDIPGLIIAAPARGDDAVGMLRTCVQAADVDGRVCAFLEPIARYNTRDLHEDGDGGWLAPFPPEVRTPLGRGRLWREGGDLTIVTYANGVYLSLRAARQLERDGVHARVFDLRWLAPLDLDGLVREASATGRVLVVDEGRRSGGIHEALISHLAIALGGDVRVGRVTAEDTYIPTGPAADLVLPDEIRIVDAAKALVGADS